MGTIAAIFIGIGIGVISGLVGIGGGAVLTPILIYAYHMTQHRAQGTSLAMLLAPSGLFAFLAYYKAGNADLKLGVMIALGVLVGGYFGAKWAQHLSNLTLRRVFAAFLIVIAIKMLTQAD
jgi:uncharacterized membrane protein YfcA